MEILEETLKKHFGYNSFRSYQKEIIEAVLAHKDVLAILPTGAGKSLCYQLPALIFPGTAIVISPLISLMQDQVCSLFKNGIPAAFLNSSLHYRDLVDLLSNLADYKLLYVAPERFSDPLFIEKLKGMDVSFFVIDEAHCISQWGHSFRSEYRKLSVLKEMFPTKPVMALTATATLDVEKDIATQLAMKQPTMIKGSFDRPNLTIRIHSKINPEKQLQDFLKLQKDQSGIIYASTRKGVESTYAFLQKEGYSVGRYHAGLSDEERSTSQTAFLHDQVTLMVATVAFGMGIHKPDIRFIVHMDMPKTIEQYYQEIGRAGRDGLPAECLMLFSTQDLLVYNSFLKQIEDISLKQLTKAKTERMFQLCTSPQCRRKSLLKYFGEVFPTSTCQGCDNCIDLDDRMDGTIIAQKILSCVFRMHQNFGIRLVIDVLRGSKSQPILSRRFDELSTHGLLKDVSEQEIRYYIDALIHQGYLMQTEGDYPILKWSETSKAIVEGKEVVQFKKKIFKQEKERPVRSEGGRPVIEHNLVLFHALRDLRLEIARQEQVPPFVVFSDRSLQEMAAYYPQNEAEFTLINGVGPIKWIKYGEKFLDAIKPFIHEKQVTPKPRTPAVPVAISAPETLQLFNQGHTIEQIMEKLQRARGTVIGYLEEAVLKGGVIDLQRFIPIEKQEAIKKVAAEEGISKLTPIKVKLPEDYTFDEIKLVVATMRKPE